MASSKLHYDGWLKLPAGLLRALGAKAGDTIEITPRDDGLVLRARGGTSSTSERPQLADPAPAEPLAAAGTPAATRRVSRRKHTASAITPSVALPPALRGAGRRKARTADEPAG
ncbi:MAG TPA: AbrB/MazE/SpoVT family DNA-binding domain-containing protein [Geminicoccaceae bacterium]|nr:AbrB/MazE/SpoVT family DNA-binding domain-containing protein [Geminicoccaceae bacterium]